MSTLTTWVFLFPFLYFVTRAIYNLFFHPLRSYPGPWYTKVSTWPWYYQRVCGTQIYWLARLHDQYGPVVRSAPDHLSYIEPDAWKDIYGHKTNFPKDMRYYGHSPSGGASILSADDEVHSRLRRSISHAFSEKALIEQEPLLRRYIDLLVMRLRDTATTGSKSVDVVRMYNFITFDFTADLTFGESLGLLERGDYSPWVANIIANFKAIGIIWSLQSAVPFLIPILMLTVLRKMVTARKKHWAVSAEHVDRRLARETDRPDIWTFVLRNSESGKGLSRGEMHSNGAAIIGAGTETTASTLSAITFLLCTHRDVLDRLNEEVRQAFDGATNDGSRMQALVRLPYLNACLQEALRLFPPAPLPLPRVTPSAGAVICGQPVAGNTTVYVPQYPAYHSERNFYDPEGFHPERWLPNPDPCFAKDRLNVLEPFNIGPRNCVGKNLAWHEMRSILTAILLNFDIELAEDANRDWLHQKAYFVWEKTPLNVKLTPRASVAQA